MLSDLQVASLLEEIASSMRSGIPISESMARLETRRLGAVARAARAIRQGVERGESTSRAMAIVSSRASAQSVAAVEACEQTNDPAVIDRVARRLRQRAGMTSDSRLAWFYPWVLLLIGYLVARFVMGPLVVRMQGRSFEWAEWVYQTAVLLQTSWLIPVVGLSVALFGLLWISGRDHFHRDARVSLFCNSLADQFLSDVPEDTAITLSAKLSGVSELSNLESPTLQSPSVKAILSKASAPNELAGLDLSDGDSLVARLRYLGAIHAEKARANRYFWSRLLPRFAMILVGGGLTLVYAYWVVGPVYQQVAQW
ncbi:MAG: type II secretion system F family protein [Rubripirellula sp.]